MHMHTIAQKLFGDSYEWSVLAAERHRWRSGRKARYWVAICGSAWRTVSISGRGRKRRHIGQGQKATSSAQQVIRIRQTVENLGFTVAAPEQARARLGLKGGDQVEF
nr:3-keto-5-aminohexanoate cleavage protein [uncultured Roseovarius sp.]